MALWKEQELIFKDEDGFEVIWGKFKDDTHKALAIRWPHFPKREDNPTWTVIPHYLIQSVLERLLTNAIVNYPDYATKVENAIKEFASYDLDKTLE